MTQIRLLPLVAFSALCLFGLKAIDLWLVGGSVFTGQTPASAEQGQAHNNNQQGQNHQNRNHQDIPKQQELHNQQAGADINRSSKTEPAPRAAMQKPDLQQGVLDKTFFENGGNTTDLKLQNQRLIAQQQQPVNQQQLSDGKQESAASRPLSREVMDFLTTGAVDEKKDQASQNAQGQNQQGAQNGQTQGGQAQNNQTQNNQQQGDAGLNQAQGGNQTDPSRHMVSGPEPHSTKAEFAVLQSLAERRKKIDAQERQIELQKNLLQAAEKKVEARISELKAMELRVQDALKKQQEGEAAQYSKLVQMYTSMKPSEAAKIFNRLEMSVLIGLVQQIKPKTMSAIMAAMDPAQVERLTLEMASQGKAASLGKQALPKINNSEAN